MNTYKTPSLHDRAMLAYLTASCWSARRLDRKASSKVTKDADAIDGAARVNKHLLAGADKALKDIQSVVTKARHYLEDNTLPWDDAGNRLLSNTGALKVIAEISAMEQEFRAMVDDFIRDYPVLRSEAISALGDLANDEDYPQPDSIRHKFAMRLSLTPLAEGFSDIRTGLDDAQVRALQTHFEANVRAQTNRALVSAWTRLQGDVAKMAERLSLAPDGARKIYRDSLVSNIRDTCALLNDLNVFADPDLDALRRETEAKLCVHDAPVLRDNMVLADAVAAEAQAILDRINSLLET